VKERLVSYQNSGGDAKAGLQVFTTHCALCHKVGQTGQVVGPQLEGAGNRGLERLCEDILDPNRDVDPAFHLRILTLKDGSVQSGLQRRTEGETLILADATGRESTLNSANIAKTETVPMSIMPPTFAETISEADFRNLLAWLLSLSQ
jgi:putative heme-binding domain-containing protein